ncbi:glycosyltransferase family 4 protein [Clostridium psychrophilum]|uniref:glycosyltransferase family 4 protein n=1 Tax=Clostridium psychrophilum TaxID=132926 RepID=UPI001C0D70E1|nr:glycosyltransferase family 4 protein [Clostridium psychrophilum]MBU3180279.1 glycosyltransferase family 4 protein [Clostridium psychrophilum]
MFYKVLHLLSTKTLNGAEKVTLDICTSLDKTIYEPIVVCAGDELKEFFEKESIQSFKINISNLNMREILKLRNLIKNENINLIHAHDVRASIAAKIASANLKIPVISHIHGEYDWLKSKSILRFIDRLFREKYDLSLACSKNVKEFYCKCNSKCHKEKVIALSNSFNFGEINKANIISKKKFEFKNNIPINKYVFGYIGRLIDLKGIDLLIESFNLFQQKHDNSILIIVGDGDQKYNLVNLVTKYNLSTKIYFIGYTRDIYNWLNIFDAFILSSKREGLPLTIFEAMAMKKIAISTSVGGIPELIKNKYNGILIEDRNPQLLMNAMEYVYENKNEAKAIVENAYNHLRLNYSITDYINTLQNIYKGLLESHKK